MCDCVCACVCVYVLGRCHIACAYMRCAVCVCLYVRVHACCARPCACAYACAVCMCIVHVQVRIALTLELEPEHPALETVLVAQSFERIVGPTYPAPMVLALLRDRAKLQRELPQAFGCACASRQLSRVGIAARVEGGRRGQRRGRCRSCEA